jgi:hypothetical protein
MHTLAHRLDRLGTETAFAVSLAASDWAAKGNHVYPFHLGDINLPTPANVIAAQERAIEMGKTGYAPAGGITPLRDALAQDVGARRGMRYAAENVAVQPGGKPTITKFIQTVMNPGDEVLYPNPGYPIYESQIEYFGGVAKPYGSAPSASGFAIDLDQLEALITPKTAALIYNNYQNPMGSESSVAEMERIAELALTHDLWVLSDEAYFETRYSGQSASIASLPGMQARTVILYTFSKKFAMTGWRLGAWAAASDRGHRQAEHERRIVHGAFRADGRHRGDLWGSVWLPHHRGCVARTARCGSGHSERYPRHVRPQAGDDVLPVRGCDRRDANQRLRRCGGVRNSGIARDGRVILHAAALRAATAGRNAPIYSTGLLRHQYARYSGRAVKVEGVGGSVAI